MSDSTQADGEPNAYRDIKKVIFTTIYEKYGVDGWTKYWDALRRFINADIGRDEMEAVVRFYLPKVISHINSLTPLYVTSCMILLTRIKEKLVHHNRLFVIIIYNIRKGGSL